MPEQTIDQHDLILISDTGEFFLVKMVPDGYGGHRPDHIEPLSLQFQGLPTIMRDNGVELADIPDNVLGGGCSCFLLNLKRLSGR